MSASVPLAQFLLPRAAVSLGRFVTNLDEPHRDFLDPVGDPGPYTTEKLQNQYDGINHSIYQRAFASKLTSFLSSSFSKRGKTSIRITSEQIKTYYLNNMREWFRDAVRSEATRKWIERTIDEGEDIYLVTGYHTLLDACIVEQAGGQHDSSGKLVLPVAAALAASGIVLPIGDMADPGLELRHESSKGEQRRFIATGEQVCAVQYRKVCHRWFSSKDLDKMKLAETRWERYDRPRFLQSDGEDMIGVELGDEVIFDEAHD